MSSNKESILIVDDEEPIRRILYDLLSRKYLCITAGGVKEATAILSAQPFNLVLVDISMPDGSGLELCEAIQKDRNDTVVIVVSGHTEIQYAIESMRQGAFDYVTKPLELQQVMMSIERALRYQTLVVAKRNYEDSLEQMVRVRTEELRVVNQDLNQTLEILYSNYRSTLRSLAEVLEARDFETRGHSNRVVAYSLRLGREMGLTNNELIALEQGALLHDIGKIGVRDSVLLKSGSFTKEEWVEMRKHIDYGLRIIDRIDFLSGAYPVVAQHHEKYDGSGYPAGLAGDEIHINARIFAVADAFDAITSDRPYRAAASFSHAKSEIVSGARRHFDPEVVKTFLQIPEAEWWRIRSTAGCEDSLGQLVGKHEIRSFIVSLKGHRISAPVIAPIPESRDSAYHYLER